MLLEQLIDGSSTEGFIGRGEILKNIYKKIEDKAAAIVVKGPGGAGKTALLGRVVSQLRKEQFAFILTEGQTHPELILKKVYEKARKKGIKDVEKIYTSKEEELRKKILWFVENYLEKEKILLIFEDFEANLNIEGKFRNERLKEFLIYLRDSLKEKSAFLLFTTEKDIPGFESQPIGEFSSEEIGKLLSCTKSLKKLGKKSREKMSFDMGGNPRVMQLLDHIASREFGEKNFEWDALKNRVPRLRERVLYKESQEADFSPLLLEKILEYLNESQQQLLTGLSLYDGPVREEALAALELKISDKDRQRLIDLSLIDFYEKMNLYRVHRLTARFFYGKMSEAEKRRLHLLAARYYENRNARKERILQEYGDVQSSENEKIKQKFLEVSKPFSKKGVAPPTAQGPGSGKTGRHEEKVFFSRKLSQSIDKKVLTRRRQEERDIADEIKARRHYLEAEEWDRAVDLTFNLDRYLTPKGYVQLSYDLIKEIENLDYSRENQVLVHQRLLVFSVLFAMFDQVISQGEKLVKIYEDVGSKKGTAQTLGQIARAFEQKRKYNEALEKFEKSRQIYEETGDTRAAAYTLIEIGKIHQKRAKYDDALIHFQKALGLAEKGNDSGGIAESLHHIGLAHETKGELDEALRYYQESRQLKEKIGDEKGMAAELHQIGNIHFLKGDSDIAFDHYQQSLALAEKFHDLRGQGYSLGQMGLIYQRRGQQKDALQQFRKSLKAFEKLGDQQGISASLHQVGRIYQEQGKLNEALKHYKKSLEIREKSADMQGMAIGYGQLGMLYYEKEEYKEALEASVKSFLLFSRMGEPRAKLAQENIRKIEKKLPREEFNAVLREYNITPVDEKSKEFH